MFINMEEKFIVVSLEEKEKIDHSYIDEFCISRRTEVIFHEESQSYIIDEKELERRKDYPEIKKISWNEKEFITIDVKTTEDIAKEESIIDPVKDDTVNEKSDSEPIK